MRSKYSNLSNDVIKETAEMFTDEMRHVKSYGMDWLKWWAECPQGGIRFVHTDEKIVNEMYMVAKAVFDEG